MGADRRDPSTRGLAALAACLTFSVVTLAPAMTLAKPTVTLNPRAVPIPKNLWEPTTSRTWPHTGDRAGAGAELEARFTIAGTEDRGLPAPLRHVAFYLPHGAHVHTRGFAKCQHPALMPRKGLPCSNGAFASVPGAELDMVNFGGTNARSPWVQGAFFPTGGGTLGFWTRVTAESPLLAGGYNPGSLTPTTGGYSYKMTETLPRRTAVNSVMDISTVSFDLTLGAAKMNGGKLISVLTMPKLCPAGGLPVKAELSFGDGAATSWETVAVVSKMPCK
jgi:hypothetical protein